MSSNKADETAPDLGFRMTELEERLAGENGAKVREEVLLALSQAGKRLERDMNAGLPRKQYQLAETAFQALAAAHQVVVHFPINK